MGRQLHNARAAGSQFLHEVGQQGILQGRQRHNAAVAVRGQTVGAQDRRGLGRVQQPQRDIAAAVALQFGQRSLKQYMAVVDDADLLDHLLHLAQKMARDQHRRARGGGHVPDERAHLLNARGVQTVRRLIQDQQLRAAQQRHGNAEPLLHAERILPDPAVAVLRQMHNVQHAADVLMGHTL